MATILGIKVGCAKTAYALKASSNARAHVGIANLPL